MKPWMVPLSDVLTEADHRSGMRHGILCACWGAIAQVMVRDSSVVIIFAALIGAGESIGVLTTAFLDLALCFLMLPFAWLSDRVGYRPQICVAALVSVGAMLCAAVAPVFGPAAPAVLVGALACFAVAISAYLAAWFPLLDTVVPAGQRSLFFGRMRVSWQLVATAFIFVSGWFVGRHATVPRLQVVIAVAGLCGLGRALHVVRMPDIRRTQRLPGFRAAMSDVLANRPMVGFALYLFFLYASANAALPVIFVFARNHLGVPDNTIVLLSAISMGGLILGFLVGGRVVHRRGVKAVLLGVHIGFALLNGALLAVHRPGTGAVVGLAVIVALYGALTACASIAVASELLALAPPNNKSISIAVGFSLYSAGLAASRGLAAFALGSGLLAPAWRLAGRPMTPYHSVFLFSSVGVLSASLLLALVPAFVRRVQRLPSG